MHAADPFTPVPLLKRRPIVVHRDRRADNVDEYIAGVGKDERLTGVNLRIRVVAVMAAVICVTVIARIAYLQIFRGPFYRSSSELNRIRLEVILAPRGIIYDRSRIPLLTNIPDFTLYAVPADLPRDRPSREAIADELSSMIPALNRDETRSKLERISLTSLTPIILLEHVDYQSALKLTSSIARTPGISLDAVATRSYSDRYSMAHLLGYLGKPTREELVENSSLSTLAQVGRMGVEAMYDTDLRGTDGIREVERDHLNKQLAIVASRDPVPGKNLILSIDKPLQETLSASLADAVARLRVTGAAAVAIDPRNGEVRALVSEPSFDPNIFTQGGRDDELQQLFDDTRDPFVFRAIGGSYPSGSTIKPVIASAGLAERIVTDKTTVMSTGGITVGPNFFPDWKSGGHGSTDVKKALAESVNTFFYMVGGGFQDFNGLGVDRIVRYMDQFGLGRKLGIDVPGEVSGFVPDKEWRERPGAARWYVGDTYNLSIGQGLINVTPLQVAMYTAAVANGGTLYRPHVLHAMEDVRGNVVATVEPNVINETVSDRYLSTVRAGMRLAVTGGSARQLQDLPVPAAAKTGTAQFGNEGKTHAWITGFAPYDRPELVITVIIEGGGEGSATAIPIAKKAFQEYFAQPVQNP